MDGDLQAKIAALTASRRAGANVRPAGSLTEWVCHKHFSEIDSTHGCVVRDRGSLDAGKLNVVSADVQTDVGINGRRAGVFTNFAFRFPEECSSAFINRNAPTCAQVLAVSTIDALSKTMLSQDGVSFSMRCPNDVVVNGRKLVCITQQILLRADIDSPDWVFLGIEVDLNTPEEELEVGSNTSLRAASGSDVPYDVDNFQRGLISTFVAALWKLFVDGFSVFTERVNALDVDIGSSLQFCIFTEDGDQHLDMDGTYVGVNDSGHVLIKQLSDGQVNAYPRWAVVIKRAVVSMRKNT